MPEQKRGKSKQDYTTPDRLIAAVKRLLGINEFAIDLAADATNAKAERFYDEAQNSLVQDWSWDGWAWLNPPYANIEPWTKKAWESRQRIAMLLPAGVGANWFANWVHDKAMVVFLNGRVEFIPGQPYPKDCILVLYGEMPGYVVWAWKEDAYYHLGAAKTESPGT